MGFAIPRIQYKNVDTTGTTTSGSGTVASLGTVVGLEVGQFFRGTGIPAGAKIGSIGTSSIVLASGVLATASATVSVSAGYEIAFDYPPVEVGGELLATNATVSESLSGIRQISINYIEGVRKLNFSHVSPTLYALIDTFLRSYALAGNQFRYYDDKSTSSYITVELNSLKVVPVKGASVGVDLYVWDVPLDLRRVI